MKFKNKLIINEDNNIFPDQDKIDAEYAYEKINEELHTLYKIFDKLELTADREKIAEMKALFDSIESFDSL